MKKIDMHVHDLKLISSDASFHLLLTKSQMHDGPRSDIKNNPKGLKVPPSHGMIKLTSSSEEDVRKRTMFIKSELIHSEILNNVHGPVCRASEGPPPSLLAQEP